MKNIITSILMISLLILSGCKSKKPNLVVQDALMDFSTQTVVVSVKNIGTANAGKHLTYIEINDVGASNTVKPQSQYSATVSNIAVGDTWTSGYLQFSEFSSPRGLDLTVLTSANLVVRADAKDFVKESNENDNLFDSNF